MKHSILIVDDEEELRGVLKDTLSEEYNILEGADGLDGLLEVMLSDKRVDLIITDLNMPDKRRTRDDQRPLQGNPGHHHIRLPAHERVPSGVE